MFLICVLRLLTWDPVAMQCYIQPWILWMCRLHPRVSAVSGAGDRISSVIAFVSETLNKYGLLSSFVLHPVTTWRPRQDRELTTSDHQEEISRYQEAGHRSHPPLRWDTLIVWDTRYATPGYIHWERVHLYMSGGLTDHSKFIKILNLYHYV